MNPIPNPDSMVTTAGRGSFSGSTWIKTVAGDPKIPNGSATAVALLIGSKIRFSSWEVQVSIHSIAERSGTTPEFVSEVTNMLVHLGYLRDLRVSRRGRRLYAPALPAHFQMYRNHAQPTDEQITRDDAEAAA
jgi:hypothetical protein